jgi:hypothetical protein
MTTTAEWLIVALALLLAVVIGLLAFRASRQRRHERLRQRFGPEYEHALEEYGNPERAERELAARAQRVHRFHVRELDEADREHFSDSWRRVQAHFVDDPSAAAQEADVLIKAVMAARGYPVEDFNQRVADLSVDHADVVQHYRAARALSEANNAGRADTEELRQAFVHYRALFAELLEAAPHSEDRSFQEARL